MKKQWLIILILSIFVISSGLISSCCKEEEFCKLDEGEEFPGGDVTVDNISQKAFTLPAPNLDGLEALQFFTGNSFFNQSWVSAPSSTTARDGLGPLFNASNCSNCHFRDGRGRPPAFTGETGHGFLFRLSVPGTGIYGEPVPAPNYGLQLQDLAVSGLQPEGDILLSYGEESGNFVDGSSYSLRRPTYEAIDLNYGAMDPNIQMSPRVARQLIGLGLLEAISETDILANADENDSNSDGISGRPNYVWNYEDSLVSLGRFGWKGQDATLRDQIAFAFKEDIGITSSIFTADNCAPNQTACDTALNGNNANGYELDDDVLDRLELYVATVAVPKRRDASSKDVLAGKRLFFDAGCEKCHKQQYVTDFHDKFAALSNQRIFPYTDMLLHDMGADLADDRPEFVAEGNEWRTPPLWGIGLIETVNGHTFLMHDGRARNVEEAILWHGGEAGPARSRFLEMSASERDQLILFVNSL